MTNDIIIYTTDDGKASIELHLDNGTVWLTQLELAELFQTSKQNISKHIKAIFEDGELDEKVVVNYQLTTTQHGAVAGKTQSRKTAYYNLDMILAIGYRVRSPRGVQFRNYASTVLKEYLIKGFAMDDDRLKNLGGGSYFKELLDRIRDIRSSEKV
ncbi:TPA: virulence RhuM family protein, partial [Streptococcus suis]|nr:virulence RhuM family protein [Streptococcus suis]